MQVLTANMMKITVFDRQFKVTISWCHVCTSNTWWNNSAMVWKTVAYKLCHLIEVISKTAVKAHVCTWGPLHMWIVVKKPQIKDGCSCHNCSAEYVNVSISSGPLICALFYQSSGLIAAHTSNMKIICIQRYFVDRIREK